MVDNKMPKTSTTTTTSSSKNKPFTNRKSHTNPIAQLQLHHELIQLQTKIYKHILIQEGEERTRTPTQEKEDEPQL